MKKIILVQHTQSIHHINGMIGSWTNWALSEKGKQQAEQIARNLARELGNQSFVIYSSDLLRAWQTAEPIARYLGMPVQEEPALRERNLGRCVGKSVKWLRANIERQEKTVDDRLFSDAESRRDEWNRLRPFFDRLMESKDEQVILVSHGDLLSCFYAMWLGLPVEALNSCDLWGRPGGVSFLTENREGKRIINRLSDMSYLKE